MTLVGSGHGGGGNCGEGSKWEWVRRRGLLLLPFVMVEKDGKEADREGRKLREELFLFCVDSREE